MAKSRSVWVPEVNLSFDFSFWLLVEVLIMTSGSASAIFGQEDDLESFLATDLLGTVVGSGGGSEGSHRVIHLTLVLTFITSSSTEGWKLEAFTEADIVETVSVSCSYLGDPTDSLDMALVPLSRGRESSLALSMLTCHPGSQHLA